MAEKTTYQKAEEAMKSYLQSAQMRLTQERLIILRHICTLPRNFTADKVVKDLCQSQHISTATIYNNLAMLCDAHILRLLPHRQQQGAQYELAIGDKNSLRYVCTQCGREVVFKNKAIEQLLLDRNFSNFEMDNFSLVVYGHCKTCRRNNNKR